jgi:hypothetical protein
MWSRPYIFFTITGVSARWEETKEFMNRLRVYLLRHNGTPNWAYSVEPNPNGTGAHIHGYNHGWLDDTLVTTFSTRNGGGHANIKQLDYSRRFPQQYFQYPMKHLRLSKYPSRDDAEHALSVYRELNGGRLIHASTDFFRDDFGKVINQTTACDYARQRYASRRSPVTEYTIPVSDN